MWNILRFFFRKTSPLSLPNIQLSVTTCKGEDGYIIAECKQIPGCMSQGKTEREAVKNILDAIQSCITVRIQEILRNEVRNDWGPSNRICSEQSFVVKPPELEHVGA